MGVIAVSQLLLGLGPNTNLLVFPGFLVRKIEANRTKEALTRCSVFTSVGEISQSVLWGLCPVI